MYLRLILFLFAVSTAGCAATADTDGRDTSGAGPVNFQELERRDTPNDYLVCPDDYCKKAKPDRMSPVFPMPAAELKKRVAVLLSKAPRTQIVSSDDTHIVAEQRSAVFGFPDTIDIAIIAVAADTSTVAIYSRSRYGYSDLGANGRRVDGWLEKLAASPK
jgi:uncharacterized protein (DUF1499 family)